VQDDVDMLAQAAQGLGEILHDFGQPDPQTKWEQLQLVRY
jgi:hypothetical protein